MLRGAIGVLLGVLRLAQPVDEFDGGRLLLRVLLAGVHPDDERGVVNALPSRLLAERGGDRSVQVEVELRVQFEGRSHRERAGRKHQRLPVREVGERTVVVHREGVVAEAVFGDFLEGLEALGHPEVGDLGLAGVDQFKSVVDRHDVHDEAVHRKLSGIAANPTRPGDRRYALTLDGEAEPLQVVDGLRKGQAQLLEQVNVHEWHVEHELVRQPELLAVERSGSDEVLVVVLHERLVAEIEPHAAAVGFGHVEELRAAERGEHVGGLAVEDVLQGLRLVVVGVLDGLLDLDTGRCGELLDDPGDHVFVFGPPVEERDLGALQVVGGASGVGCTGGSHGGDCGGGDFNLAVDKLAAFLLADQRADRLVHLLLGACSAGFCRRSSERDRCRHSGGQYARSCGREPMSLHVLPPG